MKTLCILTFMLLSAFTTAVNKPVEKVDLDRYAGKWYSLYSIPTFFDKGSRETTTSYNWDQKGYYDVLTTYKKGDDDEEVHTYKSKLFQVDNTNNSQMKAQFIWPYKVDYWIIELADDYSYVVVGHPDHKFLFIMSRKPSMDKKLYEEIISRCKAKGYAVEKLTSQHQNG